MYVYTTDEIAKRRQKFIQLPRRLVNDDGIRL